MAHGLGGKWQKTGVPWGRPICGGREDLAVFLTVTLHRFLKGVENHIQ